MATSAKLVTDLTVVLRGLRSHESVIASHVAQAADDEVAGRLREVESRERVATERVARALRGLGAPAPRVRPAWLPSPTAWVATVATQAQPLGEALVVEATAVRMLADRSRVVRGLALAVGQQAVADAAEQVDALYRDYADWLVRTASALVVDEDGAELVPSTPQRVAGRVKDAVGAPARLYGRAADHGAAVVGAAAGRARALAGFGSGTASELPVSGYDDHSAAEAVAAVRQLDTVEDVSAVVAYEAQHKDRKTVLDAGDRRVVELAAARS